MDLKKKNRQEVLVEKRVKLENGVEFPFLAFPLLEEQEWLAHCFTTRMGGVSEGIFATLNLSFNRGDDPEAVRENFRRVSEALGTQYGDFVFSDQTHTANVRRVARADAGNGLVREKTFFDTDGLITDEPGLVLSTFYADCVPLYFADPVHHAIGLSHSGWRGTVQQIGRVTVEAMGREFGSRPEDIICAIGPSICQDCYEVGAEVAMEFRELCEEAIPKENQDFSKETIPKEVGNFSGNGILAAKGNGKYQLDLWRANEIILRKVGVLPEHIAVTNICTCCNSTYLFSHRASKGRRGNLGAFLTIKA